MDARSLHPAGRKNTAPDEPATGASLPAMPAGQACCCPATAVVRVVIPSAADRPHETDLLLCGHHYRVSRCSLAAARAAIYELPGTPADTAEWIHADQGGFGARASSPAS